VIKIYERESDTSMTPEALSERRTDYGRYHPDTVHPFAHKDRQDGSYLSHERQLDLVPPGWGVPSACARFGTEIVINESKKGKDPE
jgi:hypothetical protein